MTRPVRCALAAVLLSVLAACGEDTVSPAEEAPMTPKDDRITAAVADLAGRQGVEPGDVTVVEAREVTWSDSSLGCPKHGMSYLQVLTDGFLLVLETGGVRYEYHGGRQGELRYCASPRPPVSGDM